MGISPKYMLVLSLWVGATLVGCTFDDDTAYYPITRSALLLVSDSLDTDRHLLNITDKNLTEAWEQSLNLSGTLRELGSFENECWISTANPGQVHRLDMSTGQLVETFSTEGLQPEYICVGEEYLLVSDQQTAQIGFIHKKKGTLTIIDVPDLPGKAVYRSRKFYLRIGNQSVQIFREEALAELETIPFSRPISDLQVDNQISILVFTRDSTLFRASIDYNTNSLSQPETPENSDQTEVSPIRVAQYGKEWLREVRLRDGQFSSANRRQVTDIEVDFFEAQIYYAAEDSLFQYALWDQKNTTVGSFSGKILNSFFFREVIGE